MYRNLPYSPLSNQNGFGLITAIFVITILASFGVLIARYTMTSSESSAENYVLAQALYSANSVIQQRILCRDGGGGGFPANCGGVTGPAIAGYTATITDSFADADPTGTPETLRVTANHGVNGVSRTFEVKYIKL